MRRIITNDAGATVIEFALLAPVFILFLFGTIEASRMMWMQQTLEEVAYATARCASVSASCSDTAARQAFAVARSGAYGIGITTADVTAQGNVTCRGFPTSNRVVITHGFNSVLEAMVGSFPDTLTAESCYPVMAAS